MASLLTIKSESALVSIRLLLGGIIVSHGVLHVVYNIGPLGEILLSKGIAHGVIVAWAISIAEIVGGVSFFLGKFVKPIGLYFALELALRIYFVRWQYGWFAGEAGKNGIEYNMLLVVSFLAVALTRPLWK